MKKIILSLLLCGPIFVISQQRLSSDFEVTKSTPFKVVDAKSKEYVSLGDGSTISVKTHGEKVIIQKFDVNGMKEIGRSEYEDFPKYAKIQKLLKVGVNLYYVFEAYNKKEKTFSVYYRQINTDKSSFEKINKLFTTSSPVVSMGALEKQSTSSWGFDMKPKFDVITSFDETKILIRYRNKPEIKSDAKNHDELGFYVFDNEFNEIWGKEVKMPHTEKAMNNLAYTVTSDGTAFMLARLNETKSFELITVSEEGLKNKKLAIKEGLSFNKFDLRESAGGNVLAPGYYANGTEYKVDWTGSMSTTFNVNGIYLFEIGENGEVIKENDYPFSIDLIKKYLTKRQKKKADSKEEKEKAGINDIVLREFVVNTDGSIVIVGEVFYTRKEMWMTSMNMVTHYSNMVITKIDKEGSLVWQKKLPKNQAALADAGEALATLGMSYAKGDEAHYVLFVDNAKNAMVGKIDIPAKPHKGGFGGYLTAYKVDDKTGEVEKHLIMDLTDVKGVKAYQFSVTRIFEALNKTFMTEVYIKGKKDMMIKMELN